MPNFATKTANTMSMSQSHISQVAKASLLGAKASLLGASANQQNGTLSDLLKPNARIQDSELHLAPGAPKQLDSIE